MIRLCSTRTGDSTYRRVGRGLYVASLLRTLVSGLWATRAILAYIHGSPDVYRYVSLCSGLTQWSCAVVSHAIFDAPCKPWMGNAQPLSISADRWCGGPAPCDQNGGPPAGTITVRVLLQVHAVSTYNILRKRALIHYGCVLALLVRMSCWKTSPASRRTAYSFRAGCVTSLTL